MHTRLAMEYSSAESLVMPPMTDDTPTWVKQLLEKKFSALADRVDRLEQDHLPTGAIAANLSTEGNGPDDSTPT